MDIPWEDIRLFLAVAETGSVSAAAERLKITQPTASRRLAALEARLGESLVARSVQGARLTDFGATLLEPARRMAEWSAEVDRAAERREQDPTGVVHITAAPGLAYEFVVPFAAHLREVLPQVRIELSATTRYVDLARREADLALRFERPAHRELVVLAHRELRAGAFATPAYRARLGRPDPTAADVAWIAWAPPFDDGASNSVLRRLVPGFVPAFSSDDYLVQTRAAEVGLGAIFLTHARHRFFRDTGLEALALRGLPEMPVHLSLLAARTALDVPRVRAVAELLARELEAIDTTTPAERQAARARSTKKKKTKQRRA